MVGDYMSPKQDPEDGVSRRSAIKVVGSFGATSLIGAGVSSQTAVASHKEGLWKQAVDHWHDDTDSQGDDIYEIAFDIRWNSPDWDEYSVKDTHPLGENFLTVWWDENIFGYEGIGYELSNAYYPRELESISGYPLYREKEEKSDYDIMTDHGVVQGESDGWSVEFSDIDAWWYESSGQRNTFGPCAIQYHVSLKLLHQDDSAGRVYWELGHNANTSLENITICAGAGPGSVCYNGDGDPTETLDNTSTGYRIPEN